MGRLGERYLDQPEQAVTLAEQCGWLMATEVLAVGIDFSFAPVLDLNDISDVIGDRGFAKNMQDIVPLAAAFMRGMKKQAWQLQANTSLVTAQSKPIRMLQLQLIAAHIKKFMTKICKALFSLCLN
jgi:beta-glucosidase-like glycosyl hydrolase